jgi:hypothetical protein
MSVRIDGSGFARFCSRGHESSYKNTIWKLMNTLQITTCGVPMPRCICGRRRQLVSDWSGTIEERDQISDLLLRV